MRRELKFASDFFADLRDIDGPELEHWRSCLIFRLSDYVEDVTTELPGYRWHGRYQLPHVPNISSWQWQPHGIQSANSTIWVLHSFVLVAVLFAEHANTLRGAKAIDVVLGRAESNGFPKAAFIGRT
jgi:hypothetical protein